MTASRALLIIGAGPFGLSLAAQAKDLQIDTTVVGKPMAFWKRNMPPGMILRSGVGWHLDPHTIAAYIESQGISPEEAEPLSLARYLEYAAWFQEQKGISVRPNLVDRLDLQPSPTPHFSAVLDDGTAITADAVVVATGFGSFEHVPEELTARLPAGRFQHTRDLNDLAQFAGQRCLIIGGRQSAFGSAALLRENGAAQVHVSHRHPPPSFERSDWSWVDPLVASMVDDPGYFRIHGNRANLGESHRCSHRKRTPEPGRKSDAKRVHNKLKLLSERLRSLCAQGGAAMVAYLVRHLRGHIQYFGVSGNSKGLGGTSTSPPASRSSGSTAAVSDAR